MLRVNVGACEPFNQADLAFCLAQLDRHAPGALYKLAGTVDTMPTLRNFASGI